MREIPRDPERIVHIMDAIERIDKFLQGITYEQFLSDPILYYAIVKNIEIVGEAAYMLTDSFRNSHPCMEWPMIIRMRHVLVHDYYQLDEEEIWHTATRNIPEIRPQIAAILEELNKTKI